MLFDGSPFCIFFGRGEELEGGVNLGEEPSLSLTGPVQTGTRIRVEEQEPVGDKRWVKPSPTSVHT